MPLLPSHWPAQMDLLTACQNMGPGEACILVLLGIVYLMFGYCDFKVLVTLNAMAAGAYLGALLGRTPTPWRPGRLSARSCAAAMTFPLMKYAIMIMGGIFGAALAASLWRQASLQAGPRVGGGCRG